MGLISHFLDFSLYLSFRFHCFIVCFPPSKPSSYVFRYCLLQFETFGSGSRYLNLTQVNLSLKKPNILKKNHSFWYVVCYCSVTQLCLTLCNPMDCSTPGFPVFHQLLELAQTHVRWVGDAIQWSHSVIPFSCLQSFPAWGSFLMSWLFHQLAKVLAFQLQPQSFKWIFRIDFL